MWLGVITFPRRYACAEFGLCRGRDASIGCQPKNKSTSTQKDVEFGISNIAEDFYWMSLLVEAGGDYCSTVPSALWQIYPVPVCYISYLDILGSLESTLFCVCDHHNMTVARHLRSRAPRAQVGCW